MKHRTLTGVAALVLAAGMIAWAQPDRTQPDKAQPGKPADKAQPGKPADKAVPGQPSEQEIGEAWMRAGTPGEQHKVLNALAGNWTGAVKSWHTPDGPADESKGSAANTWTLGERYLRQEWKGEFMGAPFEGLGYWGYDNVKKQYFSTWMDSMSTGVMLSTGRYDPAGKTFTMAGTFANPVTGKDEKARMILKVPDSNKHVMEMYGSDMATGKEFKMMEITYTRTGAAPSGDATNRGTGR